MEHPTLQDTSEMGKVARAELAGLLDQIEKSRHAMRQMESASREADACSIGLGRGQSAETYQASAVAHQDASETILSLLAERRAMVEALDRWAHARKAILTFEDLKGAEFKEAWRALGEAEWALSALTSGSPQKDPT